MYGVSGILFNHESPRRGAEFVTRKISLAVAQIKLGLQDELRLGNLDAVRDWGFAGDYVRAMHLMLQQDEPTDYVVGTGRMHSVRDAVRIAFSAAGLRWEDHVVIDPRLVRPAEVETLCADSRRARAELGWQTTVDFEQLMHMMVESDIRQAEQEQRYADLALASSW
jgi:GDPmannose 4,6-dehydratase